MNDVISFALSNSQKCLFCCQLFAKKKTKQTILLHLSLLTEIHLPAGVYVGAIHSTTSRASCTRRRCIT